MPIEVSDDILELLEDSNDAPMYDQSMTAIERRYRQAVRR
ncbi:hypothetical protein SAMN04488691_103195 [Haloferax larsenii]|uniref:Uncharacterized protein n=1 Tax=Haloferax larsenii TaxID=302484 RepID=A0A1H7N564_HALLR|nr:hypothetical protein SAMN04488691_103195 [Haloferax larsenii]